MSVLITGAYGRVGTSLIEHTSGEFEYRYFDRQDHSELETTVGDVSDYDILSDAIKGNNSVVHLAAESQVDGQWHSVLESNIIGGYNCIEACRENQVESLVLASSNHVVGMYEQEYAPDIYTTDHDLLLDHESVVRPDSLYATSKVFNEAVARYYVENFDYPEQVYVLRIGSVRPPAYDHPFGDAERGVERNKWARGSKEYKRAVERMSATWHSRRDVAQLIECCLHDTKTTFDIFYGISDNESTWFDLEHAHTQIGYLPVDSAEDWDEPPKS